MTSYCSPFCLKRVTCRPPSMVSSVRADRVDLDAEVGRLVAVDVDVELRLVELQVGVDVDQAGIRRAIRSSICVDVALQVLVGAARSG